MGDVFYKTPCKILEATRGFGRGYQSGIHTPYMLLHTPYDIA